MLEHKYNINFDITFDVGNNMAQNIHGVLVADHEVTEQELRERDWKVDGNIISLKFTSKEVS